MYYEINVSKLTAGGSVRGDYYKHFFATARRSCETQAEAIRVLDAITAAFPSPQFNVSLSKFEEIGQTFCDTEVEEMRQEVYRGRR